MSWTCFEKRNFMGIELDVLVGHPEHELMFLATQTIATAGLKNAKQLVQKYAPVAVDLKTAGVSVGIAQAILGHSSGALAFDLYGSNATASRGLMTEALRVIR